MGADLDKWIESLKQCEPIAEPDVKLLCHMALDVLVEESNVQHVIAPVTICAHIAPRCNIGLQQSNKGLHVQHRPVLWSY